MTKGIKTQSDGNWQARSRSEEDSTPYMWPGAKKSKHRTMQIQYIHAKGEAYSWRSSLENLPSDKLKARPPQSTLVWLRSQRVYFETGRPRVHRLTRCDGHSDLTLWPLPTLLLLLLFAFFPPKKKSPAAPGCSGSQASELVTYTPLMHSTSRAQFDCH